MTDDDRQRQHAVRGGFIEIDAGMWIRLSAIHTIREITPNGPLDHGVYEAGARSYVHWRAVDIDTGQLCYLTVGELSALIREVA